MEIFTKKGAKCTIFQSKNCNNFSSLMSSMELASAHDNSPYFVKFACIMMGMILCMIFVDFTHLLTIHFLHPLLYVVAQEYNESWLVMSVISVDRCDCVHPWSAPCWRHIQVHVHWTISSTSCSRQIFCADLDNCLTEVVTFLVCSLIIRVNYWMNHCCHHICSSGYCSTWV
jgi:hypothetical protein